MLYFGQKEDYMTTTSTSNTVASVNLKRKLHWTSSNRFHVMLTMFLKFSNKQKSPR